MAEWSFCRKCCWHSTGTFEACPRCGSKAVRHFDTDPIPKAKGNLFPVKEGKREWPRHRATREKFKGSD